MGFYRSIASIATSVVFASLVASAQEVGWTPETIEIPTRLAGSQPPVVTAVALRQDAGKVAVAGDDHLIRVWDIRERQVVQLLEGHSEWVRGLAYAPGGAWLVSVGSDGRVLVWDADGGKLAHEVPRLANAVMGVAFDAVGQRFATIGFRDRLRLFDLDSGAQIRSLLCPCSDMRALAFSPDGKWIAGGGRNGRIRIWNAVTGRVHEEFVGHEKRIRDMAFSPDSRQLATCSEDRTLRLTPLDGERPRHFSVPAGKMLSLAFVGDRHLAAGGSDNRIHVWDLASGDEVATLAGHTGSVSALAAANRILVSASFDTTVRIWKPARHVAGGQQPAARVSRLPLEGPRN